jgi:hypothetical protein
MWKNNFAQLLNEHGVSDAGQVEIHAIEPLVAEPRSFKLEIPTE